VPPAPAPLETKAINKTRPAPPETLDEFIQRYGDKTVTYKALSDTQDVLITVLKQHKEKIDALTQANTALSDRVLELEARAAVTHAD